jgi:hypothetical protein
MKLDEQKLLQALAWRCDRAFVTDYFDVIGMNHKRGLGILEKWTEKGWWDYGVSVRSGWITYEGICAAKANRAAAQGPADQGAKECAERGGDAN